jgi:hypothetical protein
MESGSTGGLLMTGIYANRQHEIAALKRFLLKSNTQRDYWKAIALRAIYELNKTTTWMHLTHEDIEAVLRQMENLEAPNA